MEEKHVFFPAKSWFNVEPFQKLSDLLVEPANEVQATHDESKHYSKHNLI